MLEKQARQGMAGAALVLLLMAMGIAPQAQASAVSVVEVNPQSFAEVKLRDDCDDGKLRDLPDAPSQGQQDAASDWTIGAVVTTPCLVVPSPAVPAGMDAGVLFEPWTWGTTDLTTCSETDDKWGAVQVEFNLVDLLYVGRLPMGMFQSGLEVDIPEAVFTSYQPYEAETAGPIEVFCEAARAAAVTKGYIEGLEWVEEQLDGKDFPAAGAIGYLPDATGDPTVVVEAEGFATITMDVSYADPFVEIGTQEWTIDATLSKRLSQCNVGTCEVILKGHIDSVDAKAGVLAP